MTASSSASSAPTWQAALDPRLTRRLMRPLKRPGVIGTRLARSVVSRFERMVGGFPLLPKLSQRWSSPEASAAGQVPIVYAQPAQPPAEAAAAAPTASSVSSTTPTQRPIVQAKRGSATSRDESHPPSSSAQLALSARPERSRSMPKNLPLRTAITPNDPAERSSVVQSDPPSSIERSIPPSFVSRSGPSSSVSSVLPVVQSRRVSGNVVQRKSIPSLSPSISKQTVETVQRQAEGTSLQSMTFASPSSAASPESSAPLPVVHPHVDGLPERFREPALNLVSPSLAQPHRERLVVRPLPAASNESHVVQRAVHQPSLTASTPEVSFMDSPTPTRPVSASADHSSPWSGSGAQPIAPLVGSHPSSAPPVIQRQAAPLEQKTQSPVIQRAPRRGGSGGGGTDIDELAEKVQAKLAHWLTIESERRGLTRWD